MRTPYRPGWSMTTILLVTLVACFLAQKLLEGVKGAFWVDDWLALSKDGMAHGFVYQLLTFQFLHGSPWHLLFNMIGLYFFGRGVEEMLGSRGMLRLYLASGVVGGLLYVGMAFAFPKVFFASVVGASAGVFGLIAAFATRAPDQPITMLVFFILPVTFKAGVLLIIEACITVGGILGEFLPYPFFHSEIAHAAHLGGMLTGIAWIRWGMMPRAPFKFWRGFTSADRPSRESVRATPRRNAKSASRKQEELPPAEFISREVDPILEKISAHGIQSLTARERQILEAARSKMARR
ncbi:MAG TPA: rhomboid family intramembrane serine protease [Verrucomicrobiae bacterium]|nr:rhomboid family intramembrane serine protease [Verrucomicrobiae bacterium]